MDRCSGIFRIEASRVDDGHFAAAIINPHREAAEKLEADHAADLETLGFPRREIEGERGLVVHAHAADRDLADFRITVGRDLFAGAGRRCRTLRFEPERGDRRRRQDGVPASVDDERERPFAVDHGVDVDVVVCQTDRHDRFDRATIDGCARGRFDRARIRGERARGPDVETRQLHRLESGRPRSTVAGHGVRHH